MLEDQSEANNVTVDAFSSWRNKSEDLIDKVANLTINDVVNNLINKVANLIRKNVRNDSHRATPSDVQVQFVGD